MYEAEDHADPCQHERPAIEVRACRVDGAFVGDVQTGHEGAPMDEVTFPVEEGDADGQGHCLNIGSKT